MLSNKNERTKRLLINQSATPDSVMKALEKPFRAQFDILIVSFTEDYEHCYTGGVRPAICISSTELNRYSPLLTVIPMTKSMQYVDKPTHVFIDCKECDGLESSGVAMAEQPHCIDRTQSIKKIGEITEVSLQKKVMKAVTIALGLEVQ